MQTQHENVPQKINILHYCKMFILVIVKQNRNKFNTWTLEYIFIDQDCLL